ncbi:MAG: hemolysin family protein [Elusimicrobiota bacterium]|jgi:putative hemolysin|nr:hemolysin family protein [Elusimicrobiota bacterium]
MFILLGTILFIFFLGVSSFMAASEIAITSLSRVRVKKLIAQKPALAQTLTTWLKSPYYLLSTILTVNVIADMMLSFSSTYVTTQAFNMIDRHIVELVNWLFTTIIILIAGDTAPKIYARMHAQKITAYSVESLSKIEKIFKPFLYPIIKLTELIFQKPSISSSRELSKEEATNIIDEGDTTGELDKETSKMLKRTLNFGELSVKKIMRPLAEMDAVNIDLSDEDFLDKAIDTLRSRIPVYKDTIENVVGYIHIKEILNVLYGEQQNKRFIKDFIRPPYFICADKKINELLKEFQIGKTHIAFIKDENNKTIGFLTLENILEEVVGGIIDEYEVAESISK